jgi:hypothetical protein
VLCCGVVLWCCAVVLCCGVVLWCCVVVFVFMCSDEIHIARQILTLGLMFHAVGSLKLQALTCTALQHGVDDIGISDTTLHMASEWNAELHIDS